MFQVIRLYDNKVISDDINTGKEAAEIAAALYQTTGLKHQPRPKVDDSWKERERARMANGEYTKVLWADADWFWDSVGSTEHFVHVSKSKPGMVAFPETPAKGLKDIQTRMKPGAYLTKYYSDRLNIRYIQTLARLFAGKYEKLELKMASTPEDIVKVYENGPSSCMSHKLEKYRGHLHPVYVYGAGDLQVAYLEASEGGVTARALVWPAKKSYGRVYGDKDRLVPLLEAAGYERNGLQGARILRIENKYAENELICPYVDHLMRVTDMGDHLLLGDVGDKVYDADSTLGTCNTVFEYCSCCGEQVGRGFSYNDEEGRIICEECLCFM